MKMQFLKGVSKDTKREFLSKLNSGQFTLNKPYDPQSPLSFDLIPESGLYLCKEDGRKLTSEEIESLPGYRMSINLVSTKEQVRNEKPPDGINLIPYTQEEYLESLLKDKSDKTIENIIICNDEGEQVLRMKANEKKISFI